MREFPSADRKSKTDEILEYFVSRSNEEVSIDEIASELEMNQKIVGSIASRLAARGMITRRSRGVYVHKEEEVNVATIKEILNHLEKTIRRAFGRQIEEKMDIPSVRDRESLAGLEDAYKRMTKVIGSRGALDLMRAVARKVATPSEFNFILVKMGLHK
ncbi:MAG: hypothetical protein JSV43_02915 [Methanobacteriota archaeon]|nr:MAG: hypothetical protein JSV43_02915 [Euryarchaeota archaeon]